MTRWAREDEEKMEILIIFFPSEKFLQFYLNIMVPGPGEEEENILMLR